MPNTRNSLGLMTVQGRCGCECIDPTINKECVGTGTGTGDDIDPESPMVCSDCDTLGTGTSALPVPCAYQIVNLCPKNNSVDVLCTKNSTVYDLQAWVADKIVFRPSCSNSGPGELCKYYALRPLAWWPGTSWFGQTSLDKTRIGPDWEHILGDFANACNAIRPCSWGDRTYTNTIGIALWTDCNGGGGTAVCLPFNRGHCIASGADPVSDSQCTFALVLDPIAGTIRPTNFFSSIGLPDFPSYTLKAGTTWDCHGCNKFIKDAVGTGTGVGTGQFDEDRWGMPNLIEVIPVIEDAQLACQSMSTEDCVSTLNPDPTCGYDTKENRNACCDPCCDCIPGRLKITCDGITYSCTSQFCVGGRTGVQSPKGPSRELCCELNGKQICAVAYCDGTNWLVDIYCDGVFQNTNIATVVNCCPLAFFFTFGLSCMDCQGCGTVGDTSCDPPEPEVCCPCEDLPATAQITDGTNTVEMNKTDCITFPNGEYVMDPERFCGEDLVNATVQCLNGNWTITGFFPTANLTKTGDCSALILTGTWGGCSVTVTI